MNREVHVRFSACRSTRFSSRSAGEQKTQRRDKTFLEKAGQLFWRFQILPTLLKAAGKASASLPPAGSMPDDIDIERGHHDHEHAPAGPHTLPMTMPAPEKAADAPEASPAVQRHPRAGKRTSGATGAARRQS
jgi:hypothetical protein